MATSSSSNIYTPTPIYQPIPSKPQTSEWYDLMGKNWGITAPTYGATYQNYYNKLMGKAPDYTGQYYSLLGQSPDYMSYYDTLLKQTPDYMSGYNQLMGQAPQLTTPDYMQYYNQLTSGTPTLGSLGAEPDLMEYARLIMQAQPQVGGAGLGLYGSDLLNQLTSSATRNLASPGGGAVNWAAGAEQKALQQLADQYAGWGRGSGVGQAAQAQTMRDFAKTRADAAVVAQQQAIANAQGLEGIKGGFFENAKQRELANRQLATSLYGTTTSALSGLPSAMANIYGTKAGYLGGIYGTQAGLLGQLAGAQAQGQGTEANYLSNIYGTQANLLANLVNTGAGIYGTQAGLLGQAMGAGTQDQATRAALLGQLGGYGSADYATQQKMLSELGALLGQEYTGQAGAEQQGYANLQALLAAQQGMYDPAYLEAMQQYNYLQTLPQYTQYPNYLLPSQSLY